MKIEMKVTFSEEDIFEALRAKLPTIDAVGEWTFVLRYSEVRATFEQKEPPIVTCPELAAAIRHSPSDLPIPGLPEPSGRWQI